MSTISLNNSRRWGGWWMAAFISFPIGGLAAAALVGAVEAPLEAVIGGGVVGAVVGLAQWIVLQQVYRLGGRWIAMSAVGHAAGSGLSAALFGTATTSEAIALRAVMTGLVWGGAQWWMLRQVQPRRAVWWVPTVTLAYWIGWLVTSAVIGSSVELGFSVFGSSGALVFQAITGLVLWRLIGTEQA